MKLALIIAGIVLLLNILFIIWGYRWESHKYGRSSPTELARRNRNPSDRRRAFSQSVSSEREALK